MILLALHKVAKEFPDGEVFSNITWEIKTGDKIGLLGINGVGKTTLLRIMAGDLEADQGAITRGRGVKIGRLRQIPDLRLTERLFDYVAEGRRDILDLRTAIDEVTTQLAADPDNADLTDKLGQYQHHYEAVGGFELEHRVGTTLSGLGFTVGEFKKSLATFSGGERTRAELARVLLADDDVLLLDEPTNHLDLQSIEWLEEFITKSEKAVIFVTHDRVFLDNVAQSIVEMTPTGLERYSRGYENYRAERERRREQQRDIYERQQAEIARIEDFIARNIAGQKTKQAQSRRKTLAKMKRYEKPDAERERMNIEFSPRMASYRDVLTVKDYAREMAGRTLLRETNLAIERGDHVGLIGPNGSGKTTFLRAILGEDHDYTGEITLGNRVKPGYFDQNLGMIVDEGTVIDQIWDEHPKFQAFELRSFLARFLFSGDDVFKSVATLSGGERARLALAKLMLTEANFLILDEPTNHLDIPSREVLEDALQGFEGTLLVVSHDRYFLNRIIDKLAVIKNQSITFHLGNYADYQDRLAQQDEPPETADTKPAKTGNVEWEQLRQQRRDRQKRERERERLEQAIHQTEDRLQEIDDLLVDETVQSDWQRLAELGDEKKLLTAHLEELYPQWEALADEG